MQIKKENTEIILELSGQNFILDPQRLKSKENYTFIFSKFEEKLNYDKIFASPGEYNVGEVFIYSFLNKNNQLIHLFESEEGFLLFTNSPLENDNFKKIREITSKIEALVFGEKFPLDELVNKFGIENLITDKNFNLPGFEKNKGKSFKINLKRSEKQIYLLD